MTSPDTVQVLMEQRDRLFAYIWTIVHDVQLAEDVFQELSILAVKKCGEVEDRPRLILWLRRAARLQALAMCRQRSRSPVILDEAVLDQLDSYWTERDTDSAGKEMNALRECVGQLTAKNLHILSLKHVDGKKAPEIAEILGRSVEVVYTMVARIHKSLRECVQARLLMGAANE